MNETPSFSSLESLSIVFYDGECGLCNRTVNFIIKHDRGRAFHFLSLQSSKGEEFLRTQGVEEILLDTLYVTHEGAVYDRSDAVIQIFKRLKGHGLCLFSFLLGVFPKRVRDWWYDLIAHYRYHLFKSSSCPLMLPEERNRFL